MFPGCCDLHGKQPKLLRVHVAILTDVVSRVQAVSNGPERGTSDVIDARLTVVAEGLGTFSLTSDREDMSRLNARIEVY